MISIGDFGKVAFFAIVGFFCEGVVCRGGDEAIQVRALFWVSCNQRCARCCSGHFDVFDFVGGDERLEKFKGWDVPRLPTTNITRAKSGLSTLKSLRLERNHMRRSSNYDYLPFQKPSRREIDSP